ncbi:MAG: helix-turn-helix transcriptional regulator [Alphaproteobacteria bacterium]|nr:helix-turn-helix transcriptional regulator [Alphaproteobacteria bacterium]
MAATNEFSPCHYQSLSVTPIDKYIGRQIKLRRNYLKMSQDKLGQSVGLTFQQIQKYEKGLNRISVSRLWQISHALQVNILYFFENIPQDILNDCTDNECQTPPQPSPLYYSETDLKRLNAFNKINNSQIISILDRLLNTLAFPYKKENN